MNTTPHERPNLLDIQRRSDDALLHESDDPTQYAEIAWASARDVPALLAALADMVATIERHDPWKVGQPSGTTTELAVRERILLDVLGARSRHVDATDVDGNPVTSPVPFQPRRIRDGVDLAGVPLGSVVISGDNTVVAQRMSEHEWALTGSTRVITTREVASLSGLRLVHTPAGAA